VIGPMVNEPLRTGVSVYSVVRELEVCPFTMVVDCEVPVASAVIWGRAGKCGSGMSPSAVMVTERVAL